MTQEFEGRTEEEAIDKAIVELDLKREEFDVEVIEEKRGLFRKGTVRIRVHVNNLGGGQKGNSGFPRFVDGNMDPSQAPARRPKDRKPAGGTKAKPKPKPKGKEKEPAKPPEEAETKGQKIGEADERKIIDFLNTVVERMGYSNTVSVQRREGRKLVLEIESEHAGALIGRKGKNLDALQLLCNVFCNRFSPTPKVILDTENYRGRREESLRKLALKTADQVRKSGGSELLEPMNPFERRLIHTTLNDTKDIETESEGDGLYKQVRVMYRGN